MMDPSGAFNNQAAASADEAEQALKSWGVEYERKPDGSLFVPGRLNISFRDLTCLPDLTSVTVGGDFDCSNNKLTSLKGAPAVVGGGFYCHRNQLASLEGAPASVAGNFNCCSNRLTSLKGGPVHVGERFICDDNPLAFLEGAPETFQSMETDFGNFSSWEEVPVARRACPETRARRIEAAVVDATVLQAAMSVRSPLRFKTRAFALQP